MKLLSFEDIGRNMGISSSTASRIYKEIINKLKEDCKLSREDIAEIIREVDDNVIFYDIMVEKIYQTVLGDDVLKGFWKEENNY